MLIWLIRHALTLPGERHRYQGRLDTPLSPRGRAALRAAAFSPARVYVSPLLRARETASLLFPASEPVCVDALREMDFGVFEGRSAREMEQDAAYRAWVESGCQSRCPGGEDKAGYCARVRDAFAALVDDGLAAGEETLVLVAHGGTQMAVLEHWGRPARAYWQWQTPCAGGWLLDAARWPAALAVKEEVSFTV